ncbi:MAG: hypothetical protein NVV60_03180 [Luteimonas sp.]|nr:hypothetical protein [Luteimonas sp.]
MSQGADRLFEMFNLLRDLPPVSQDEWLRNECTSEPELHDALRRMLEADRQACILDEGVDAIVDLDDCIAGDGDDDGAAIGSRVGQWTLDGMLGRGGMGSVYAAHRRDGDILLRAAIKRLHRRWDGSAQAQRFVQERQILSMLSHPNIASLLDGGWMRRAGRGWRWNMSKARM